MSHSSLRQHSKYDRVLRSDIQCITIFFATVRSILYDSSRQLKVSQDFCDNIWSKHIPLLDFYYLVFLGPSQDCSRQYLVRCMALYSLIQGIIGFFVTAVNDQHTYWTILRDNIQDIAGFFAPIFRYCAVLRDNIQGRHVPLLYF